MSRYIDADKFEENKLYLRARLEFPDGTKTGGYWAVLSSVVIKDAQTEDVAPVVRCKDCVYGEIDDPDFPNQYLCHYYGDIWNDGVHFCSNGELRNDR